MESFTPKFDMKELQDVYELHGELPGIDQKDVGIEFTDASTLMIKGLVEGSFAHEPGIDTGANTESPGTEITGIQNGNGEKSGFNDRYWIMERSTGKFSRAFDFPKQVNQDAVKASMRNGILSIIVPKKQRQEGRKIMIQ
ncbi:30 kDa heat shock protein [Golovinomyces cichoracearum]|uniref:30 kDa heat shock protein n=1 Tax=Golovinomyces cichoracearum TaxID=62708 RepID=A0A420HBW8_9PEZI|nr:30 kDa heat shock protein [Golovinomyces cichoracearum]